MRRAIAVIVFLTKLGVGALHAGEGGLKLELTPTIHCLGMRIKGVPVDATGAKAQYRAVGEKDWKEGLPLVVCLGNKYVDEGGGGETQASWEDSAPIIRRLHGSIFWLAPETQYEVQATLTDKDGKAQGAVSGTVKTLADKVTYGKGRTLKVGANEQYKAILEAIREAKPGDTVLVTPGTYKESLWLENWPSGEPGNPITLRGEKGAILDGDDVAQVGDVHAGINIKKAHDIVIEGFLIRRYDYCIFVDTCRRIAIQRNFIDATANDAFARYGLRVKNSGDCLVQFNSVREPKTYEQDKYTKYPYNLQNNRRTIFRYNRMLGGVNHQCFQIRDREEDSDIYENVLLSDSHGIMLEGCVNVNLRLFHNILAARGAAILGSAKVGPVYAIRNVFPCEGQAVGLSCDSVPLFFYHNTFYNAPFACGACAVRGRLAFLNNIVWGKAGADSALDATGAGAEPFQAAVDYNLYWDNGKTAKSPTPGLDEHSLFADPLFADAGKDDFTVKEGSPVLDKAMRLPNINDNFVAKGPDIGALEVGGDNWVEKAMERIKDCPGE